MIFPHEGCCYTLPYTSVLTCTLRILSSVASTHSVLATHARHCPRPSDTKEDKTSFRFLVFVSLENSELQVASKE